MPGVNPIRTTSPIRCGAGSSWLLNGLVWRVALSCHSQANHCQGVRCRPSLLVLGADTFSPTKVGALSVAVHPDDWWCLSSCLLTLIPFIQAPHLTSPAKGQPNPRKSQVATLQESPIWQSPQKVPCGNIHIPRKSFIWQTTAEAMSKFSVDP